VPRGRWVNITIKEETRELLRGMCGGVSLDECIAERLRYCSPVNSQVNNICNELVKQAALFLRAHGYGLHARLLEEMYSKRTVRLDLAEALKDHDEIAHTHFVGFPPVAVFFDNYESEGRLFIEVKSWLKPCFMG
jgi:hypothetical protein